MLTSDSPSVLAMMKEEDKDHKVSGKADGRSYHNIQEDYPSLPTLPLPFYTYYGRIYTFMAIEIGSMGHLGRQSRPGRGGLLGLSGLVPLMTFTGFIFVSRTV
jgi:hypothetical protein